MVVEEEFVVRKENLGNIENACDALINIKDQIESVDRLGGEEEGEVRKESFEDKEEDDAKDALFKAEDKN